MTEQLTESYTFIQNMRQVVHDVRQPLSGIENIAYILEMALSGTDPKAAARLEQLRQLVDQTNWILEDAVQAVQPLEPRFSTFDLCQFLRSFAGQVALGEHRNLNLRLPAEPVMVSLDPELAERMLQWVMQFGVSVAQGPDSPRVTCVKEFGRALMTVSVAPADGDVSLSAELLDPRSRTGFLRSLAEAQRSSLLVGDNGSGSLAVEIGYPLA